MDRYITLKRGTLEVSLCVPEQVYRGARFDHSTVFETVRWDGHLFTSVELPEGMEGVTTDGVGMIGEFKATETGTFREDVPGSPFMKLGVGTLVNDRPGKYSFFADYPIAEPCRHRVEFGEDWARIVSAHSELDGYCALLTKEITLTESGLNMTCTLKNTGTKAIEGMEYNHNFLLIDGIPVGEGGYRLKLPEGLDMSPVSGDFLTVEGREIRFTRSPEVFFYSLTGPVADRGPRWELTCEGAGVGVREWGSGKRCKTDLWGKSYVISAEAYVDISVQPGESVSWQRNWEFFRL